MLCLKEQSLVHDSPSGLEGYFSALIEKALFCGHFSSFRLSWFQAQIPDTRGKILAPAMAEVMLGYADTPQKAITQSGGTAKRYSRRKYAILNNLAPAVRGYGDGRAGKRAMVEMCVEQVKHFLGFLYDFRYL